MKIFKSPEIKKPNFYRTDAVADLVGIKPQTIRAALCRDGHYYGLKPIKLPNRLLVWNVEDVHDWLTKKGYE
jgi:hypothetical protein